MSVADRDRLVIEEYAKLGRHLSGVWRRERVRCALCRMMRGVLNAYSYAGLALVGIVPYAIQDPTEAQMPPTPPPTPSTPPTPPMEE